MFRIIHGDYNQFNIICKKRDYNSRDEQHPEIKPIQKDQYGVYEQVRNIKTVEERILKR